MKNIDLYTTAAKCIKNKIKFLFDMGYTIKSTNYNYDYGEYNALQIIVSNDIIYRKIQMGLFDYPDNKYFFFFKIYNTNDQSCMYDSFSLEHYFVEKDIPFDINLVDLDYYNGTDEERINQLLDCICNILQKYLMPILSGKEWEEIDYWYGTK